MPARRPASGKRPTPRQMTPAQAWALATRIYHDFDEPQAERERAWLMRASRAYAAGNALHLARMVDVCVLLQIPPPELLAPALAGVLRAAAIGEPLRSGNTGRHAHTLRKAAEAVLAVESLMIFEALPAIRRERRHDLPRGYSAADRAAEYFQAHAVHYELERKTGQFHRRALPTSRGGHLPRSADAIDKHAVKARKLLHDPKMREFLGANFPPRLLERLAAERKKPA